MCPSGWSYFAEGNGMAPSSPHVLRHETMHAGRFLVPGYDQKSPIASSAFPLGNLEDRTHTHSLTASITTVQP